MGLNSEELIPTLIDHIETAISELKVQEHSPHVAGKIEGLWVVLDWLRTYATPPAPMPTQEEPCR